MEHIDMKETTDPSPPRLRYAKPGVHDNGPIPRLTAGADSVGEPEGDSRYCAEAAVRLRPRG